jgi:hypothetical protein
MTDIKRAFATVNSACLRKKNARNENLVGWVKSFMEERWVEMVINGDGGELIGCSTGLPQGSSVSPILSLIYISDLPKAVEKAEENVLILSFVDDVTRVATGTKRRINWNLVLSEHWSGPKKMQYSLNQEKPRQYFLQRKKQSIRQPLE